MQRTDKTNSDIVDDNYTTTTFADTERIDEMLDSLDR